MPLAQQASALGGSYTWTSPNYNGTNLNDLSNGAGAPDQSISADGRYSLFVTGATDAVPNDTNGYRDIFRHDRLTNTNELVSVGNSGQQGNGDAYGSDVAISGDGRYVVFTTIADNLVSNDYNNAADTYVRDMQAGTTTRVCASPWGGIWCGAVSMSRDGRYITYTLSDPFTYNNVREMYRYDRQTGNRELVSSSANGVPGNGSGTNWSRISPDGRYVLFDSYSTNLVSNDTNGKLDIFRKDMQTGDVQLVSSAGSTLSNGDSEWPTMSDDGRFVSFMSLANNLVSGTSGTAWRLYLKDVDQGTIQAVSGSPNNGAGNGIVSGDGSHVMFETASQLTTSDTDNNQDIYSWDRVANTNTRLSEKPDGTNWGGYYGFRLAGMSPDGRYIAIGTNASVDPNDNGIAQDTYTYDAGPAAPTNLTAATPTKNKPVLSWDAVSGASSYKVYRNGTVVGTTSSTTFTDTAATEGSIAYKVTAIANGIESTPSNTVTVVYDVTRPTMSFTAPTSFAGPFATGPTVTVVASDTDSGLSSMAIHVYTGAGQLLTTCGSATPAQLAAGTMSCDLSSLPSGTYNVRAGAFDGAGNNRTINSGNFVIQ